MKPVLCILMVVLCMSLTVSIAGAAEERPASEVGVVVTAEKSETATVAVSESAVTGDTPLQSEDVNTGMLSDGAVEKTAAVQTASWGEIKRKFKDR